MEKELEFLGGALEEPKRPFVAILGGAKVKDKIGVIEALLDKADTLIIGGGMAYTFFKAEGYEIGKSLLDPERLDFALEVMEKAKEKGVELLFPVDIVVGKERTADTEYKIVDFKEIPADWEGLDSGPKTTGSLAKRLRKQAQWFGTDPWASLNWNPLLPEPAASQKQWQLLRQ